MGATLKFRCPQCGYETDEISDGPGLFSPVAYLTYVCRDCQSIMGKRTDENWNLSDEDNQCDYCHSTNLVPWEGGLCPRCQGKMQGECVGLWD